jgi:hypothetical protein
MGAFLVSADSKRVRDERAGRGREDFGLKDVPPTRMFFVKM